MALLETQDKERKGPSLVVQIGALVGLTAMTAGIGWFAGDVLQNRVGPVEADTPAPKGIKPESDAEGEDIVPQPPGLLAIDPITTNLAEPRNVWVRAELALMFAGEPDFAMAQAVHQDLLAYMRTIRLRQVESASGFQHFRADMEERARIRSEGKVQKIIFRTLLFE